jgi:UDP-N-acetylmuramoyl-tripeptide--D-alanyl-D-alanine ligase
MGHLWAALPAGQRGRRADTAAELGDDLAALVQPGDVVLVKGSLGVRLGPLVAALRNMGAAAPEQHGTTD